MSNYIQLYMILQDGLHAVTWILQYSLHDSLHGKKVQTDHDEGGVGIWTLNLQIVGPMHSQQSQKHPKKHILVMIPITPYWNI